MLEQSRAICGPGHLFVILGNMVLVGRTVVGISFSLIGDGVNVGLCKPHMHASFKPSGPACPAGADVEDGPRWAMARTCVF